MSLDHETNTSPCYEVRYLTPEEMEAYRQEAFEESDVIYVDFVNKRRINAPTS